jgi:hypothetical protein
MSMEKLIHRRASKYVEALQDPDGCFPLEQNMKSHVPLETGNGTTKRGRPPTDGVAATGHIHIRTTLHRKGAWVRAAKPKSLSDWATENLDQAAKYEPPQQ